MRDHFSHALSYIRFSNLFGEDSVKETGSLMQSLGGKKALIVTDAFLAKNGMAANIQAILSESGVDSTVFDGVEPNPKDVNVDAGLEAFRTNGCDSIISLGYVHAMAHQLGGMYNLPHGI